MARKEIFDLFEQYVYPFRVTDGEGFRLKDFDPGHTCELQLDKGHATLLLQRGIAWLAEAQESRFFFQAMDAVGKVSGDGCGR